MSLKNAVVVPLIPIVWQAGTPACGCGNPSCKQIGKHPAIPYAKLRQGDIMTPPRPGGGLAIKTGAGPAGSDVIVLDCDGMQAVQEANQRGFLRETYMVKTPRIGGGLHVYYKHPGGRIRSGAKLWESPDRKSAIDIRGDGGIVVAAGSPHKSGGFYEVIDARDPVDAPPELVNWLRSMQADASDGVIVEYPGDVTFEANGLEHEYRKHLYRSYLREAPPCVEGQGGDKQIYKVVQYGAYDLQLPTAVVLDMIATEYDHRCVPPWGDELAKKVTYDCEFVKTSSTRERRVPPSAVMAMTLTTIQANLEAKEVVAKDKSTAEGPTGQGSVRSAVWGGWDKPVDPPKYLIKDYLCEGKIHMVYADAGSTKSWVTLDMALAIATGKPWLGFATAPGKVLYIDYEDGRYEFSRRTKLLNGGADCPNLGYVYHAGDVSEISFWGALVEVVQAHDIKLVIIDTWSGAAASADENSAQEIKIGLEHAGVLTEATKCALWVVHHANKSGDIRGSSAIKGKCDVVYRLETMSEDKERGVHRSHFECVKSNTKHPRKLNVEFSDAGLTTFDLPRETMEEDRPKVLSDEEFRAKILLVITSERIASSRLLLERTGGKRSRLLAHLADLQAMGQVSKVDDVYILDSDAKRTARVLDAKSEPGLISPAKLATAAEVPTSYVETMLRDGIITPILEGKDIVGWR